jgi:hypothetical protein
MRPSCASNWCASASRSLSDTASITILLFPAPQNMLEQLRADRNAYRKTLLDQKKDMKVPPVCFCPAPFFDCSSSSARLPSFAQDYKRKFMNLNGEIRTLREQIDDKATGNGCSPSSSWSGRLFSMVLTPHAGRFNRVGQADAGARQRQHGH